MNSMQNTNTHDATMTSNQLFRIDILSTGLVSIMANDDDANDTQQVGYDVNCDGHFNHKSRLVGKERGKPAEGFGGRSGRVEGTWPLRFYKRLTTRYVRLPGERGSA